MLSAETLSHISFDLFLACRWTVWEESIFFVIFSTWRWVGGFHRHRSYNNSTRQAQSSAKAELWKNGLSCIRFTYLL